MWTGKDVNGDIPPRYSGWTTADRKADAGDEWRELDTLIKAADIRTGGGVYTNQTPNVEAGLGPFVRFGYLIKCLNGLCIPNDGKGKPMVTISNLLYTNNFEPNASTNSKDIYPSCYSPLLFDTSIPDNLISKIKDRGYIDTVATATSFAKDVDKQLDDYVIAERNLTDVNYGSLSNKKKHLSTDKLGALWKGYAFPDNKFVREKASPTYQGNFHGHVEDAHDLQLLHAGSSNPSKVLFPHQFQLNDQTALVPRNTSAGNGTRNAGMVDGSFFTKWTTYSGITRDRFQGLFSLPLTGYDPITQKARGYYFSEIFHYTNWNEPDGNAPNTLFETGAGSYLDGLSAQAMIDSMQFLYDQNKIKKSYFESFLTTVGADSLLNTGTIFGGPKSGLSAYFTGLESESNKKYNKERVIDNIYLNSFWLDEFVKKNSNNLTIDKLLGEICSKINAASGGSTDLKVVTNPVFNDMISIIDFNINAGALKEDKNKMFVFPKSGGFTSLYKKINLSGKIPSAMASSIAIAAQGPKDEGNIASTTYKTFIVDVEDRIAKGTSGNASESSLQKQNENKYKNYKKKYVSFFKNSYQLMRLYSSMHMEAPHISKEWFNSYESSGIGASKSMVKDITFLSNNKPSGGNTIVSTVNPSSPITAILPLKITITTEGISGILASNVFKIAQGMLPERYNSPRVSYMVSKESQTVKGMVWETTIEGSMVLDDSDSKSTVQLKGRTVTPTPKVIPPSSDTPVWTTVTATEGGFGTADQGNIFRSWIIENIGNELIAELFTRLGFGSTELSETSSSYKLGDTSFKYVEAAYNEWGVEFEEYLNPTPAPLDNPINPSDLSALFEEEEVEEVVEVEDPYFEKVTLPIATYTTPEGYEAVIVSSPRGPRKAREAASKLHGGWDIV